MPAHPDSPSGSVPGTVHLVDLDHSMHTRHAQGGDIVLVPTPSKDPDDPLNWSPRRKYLSSLCSNLYTWFTGMLEFTLLAAIRFEIREASSISDLYPRFFVFGGEYHEIGQIHVQGADYTSAYVKSDGEWLAKCIVQGFFNAPIEALPEISVTDIYFTHQRGTWMGMYAFTLAGSNYFTPVLCGFIAEYQGWRWVFYWPAIFLAFVFVFLFLFMEETNYVRATAGIVEDTDSPPPESTVGTDAEKNPTLANANSSRASTENGIVTKPPKTFVQKLSVWNPTPGDNMIRRAIRSLKYLGWPVIFYAGFSYGSYLIWFNVLNATASIILGSPPYNFAASMVGLSYVSCTLGVIIGSLISGRLSDWLTIKVARRNNGIMEAEHRLWPFALCVIFVPGSLILWGVGAAHGVHWFGLIFAMGALACSTTFGVTLSVNYLVDSYHEISGDALVAVILVRNTMSFAISYGITPWLTNLGYQNCFISAAFVGMAASSVFFIMIKWGKGFRTKSARRYWEIVEANKLMAVRK
ncbi:hypothetical protein LTR10_021634 [Elasticomyces elasticus]|uniref:Major facilitator superfamily (MFS) profile domain-containing protein n=1 Tax=Exophiala sideris TaxID=1016849 RepID=A0ABR0J2L9_9EURO|nr:hypothetical protein LTR10_021634 [Elasticomyces elasticus]KAK5024122.1 hypothetical protein LTS07_008857 [Exophiala sideris]KAK5029018.1 hypothetical protein LTR13_008888 [Exophiala sideris]KAK5054834.1 hypothetical protein LTR69_008742 [Exophiala sideris]KAK5178841.1 hypothetical protein LTR44_008669 [Eurotiomycetes sp. CCFEE 6388]